MKLQQLYIVIILYFVHYFSMADLDFIIFITYHHDSFRQQCISSIDSIGSDFD